MCFSIGGVEQTPALLHARHADIVQQEAALTS